MTTIVLGACCWASPLTAQAADYEIIIDDDLAITNQDIIFEYINVGPGFSMGAPIWIINNSSAAMEIKLAAITPDPADDNLMLPYVKLALIRAGVVMVSGTLENSRDLTEVAFCVPETTKDKLLAYFELPDWVGNVAQNTSLQLIYTFEIATIDECVIELPPTEMEDSELENPAESESLPWLEAWMEAEAETESKTPEVLPPTGESMLTFYILGGIAAVSLGAMVGLGLILLITKRVERGREKKVVPATESKDKNKEGGEGKKTKEKKRRKKRGRRKIIIVADVFFGLCLLVLLGAIWLTVQVRKTEEAVVVGGYRPFIIATGSMEPTLRINGLVITRYDDFDDVEIGDVVAFMARGLHGKPALHRVIDIEGEGENKQFVVKGDNNPNPDGAAVTKQNYIGRAIANTNLTASYFNILYHQPHGKLKAIVLPMVMLGLLYLAVIWLVGSRKKWQSKSMAAAATVFMVSTAIFLSYTIFTVRKVDFTNQTLTQVAQDFARCEAGGNWQVANQEVIGRIEIPKIGIDYPIIKYARATSLDIAITHFAGAKINASGNTVLAGHRAFGRTSPFNIFFTAIDKLEVGDEIYLTDMNCGRVKYLVTDFRTVEPDDVSVLEQSVDGRKYLTLVSCSYDLKDRYIVEAIAD